MKQSFVVTRVFSLSQWFMFLIALLGTVAIMIWQGFYNFYMMTLIIGIAIATTIAFYLRKSVEVDLDARSLYRVITLFNKNLFKQHEVFIDEIAKLFLVQSNYSQTTGKHAAHSYVGYFSEYDVYLKLENNSTYFLASYPNYEVAKERGKELGHKIGIQLEKRSM